MQQDLSRLVRNWTAIFSTLLLCAACSRTVTLNGFAFPDEVQRYNETILDALSDTTTEVIVAELSSELAAIQDVEANISAVQAMAQKHPMEFALTASQSSRTVNENGDRTRYYSRWESVHGDGFLTVEMTVLADAECCVIESLNVVESESRPSIENNWGEAPLTIGRIMFLVLATANFVFIIGTLIACGRDRHIPRRKWLWMVFIAFGLWGVTLNWTTGDISPNFIDLNPQTGSFNLSLLKFQLLGTEFGKSGVYAPWLISMGLPGGALLYWWRRRKWVSGSGDKTPSN